MSDQKTALKQKIRNLSDIEKIKKEALKRISIRLKDPAEKQGLPGKTEYHIMLCCGTSCMSSGADLVKKVFNENFEKYNIQEDVTLVETGCNGFCAGGPIVMVYPGGYFYQKVQPEDVEEIVTSHIIKDEPVERLMFRNPVNDDIIPKYKDIYFFALQNLRVLHNKGLIAAEKIEDYIARDGYFGMHKALTEMESEDIIEEIKKSGLRGRGGAGFPTGLKWQFCSNAPGDKKYIICNADEGDPGAFMDRSLLESDPHAVIEGMIIGAKAIGADTGYIYCRAEYPLALHRLEHSIDECRETGLLGKNIMGTDFSFDIHIARGSGAFVCGEETALMRSIEGKRGEPRSRPPFPAVKGLFGKPSVLNNVETFGNIAQIIRNGSGWFKSVGTKTSSGTKIFALTGNVNNIGLVEVNMGTPLGDIIYEIGGGIPGGKKFKAAQIGGPSGGCLTKEHLNVPIDYESVMELGAIMGSGGLIVMDEDTCMVDMARFFLEFTQEESCGKCVPCRVGTKRMLEIVTRICEGKGVPEDIDRLIELGQEIKDSAFCGLGQTAPNPVLSTIKYFRDEYEAHIYEKRCPAGVCPSLVRAPCQSGCPANVDVPAFVALTGEKRYAEALLVHRNRNPFASVCSRVCFHTCEDKCRRTTLDEAVAIRGIKRYMVDQEVILQTPEHVENEKNAGRKIAIIGGGPAGLSCGYFLARLGYKPKIFESEYRPGGMLIQTIPAYRLPREALAREIRMIEHLGVEIETGKALGRDFTISSLREEGYEAVFLGIGAPDPIKLGVDGEDAENVVDAIPFLKQYNIRGSVPVGKNVIIVGGGNAAVDAARTSLRLGAETVTIIYRRSQEEMPAYQEEIEEALYEGVELKTLTKPIEVLKDRKGAVCGIKCVTMILGEYDRSGRRRPTEKGGKTFTLDADQIIIAIGQKFKSENIIKDYNPVITKRGFLETNPVTGQCSLPWLFAGGDNATGPASVVHAIAGGETAAVGIHSYLKGEGEPFWREEQIIDTEYDPDADPVPYPREKPRSISVEKRKHNFEEVELSWNESVAIRQCRRCLRCDYGKVAGPLVDIAKQVVSEEEVHA